MITCKIFFVILFTFKSTLFFLSIRYLARYAHIPRTMKNFSRTMSRQHHPIPPLSLSLQMYSYLSNYGWLSRRVYFYKIVACYFYKYMLALLFLPTKRLKSFQCDFINISFRRVDKLPPDFNAKSFIFTFSSYICTNHQKYE